jgi:site-specific recombinase XerD
MGKNKNHHGQLPPPTLTTAECSLLLGQVQRHGSTDGCRMRSARNYSIFLLMLDAGLRVGEVVNLKVGDLVFEGKPVMTLVISEKISKCLNDRALPLTQRLHESLYRLNNYWFHPLDKNHLDYAFTNARNKKPLNRRTVSDFLGAAAMLSIHRHVWPHMLRHTFATRIVRKSSTATAQQLLGHRYLSSTQVYCHPNQDDLKVAIRKLDQE